MSNLLSDDIIFWGAAQKMMDRFKQWLHGQQGSWWEPYPFILLPIVATFNEWLHLKRGIDEMKEKLCT